jgi:hypothetical protein
MNFEEANLFWLIGTHRSGTTLLSRALEEMGCFMGWRKDRNNEATFFQKENNRLMAEAGASWDNPESFKWLLGQSKLCEKRARETRSRFTSLRGLEFWRELYFSKKKRELQCWGWKDPRMSITGPIWLKASLTPKVIRIVRNGVDVAASLHTREQMFFDKNLAKRPISARCLTLEGAFSLWEEYINAENYWLKMNPELEIMTFRYEDFLQSPESILTNVSDFLCLKFNKNVIPEVDPSRRHAFLSDATFKDFYMSVKDRPLMKQFSYDNIAV